MITPTTRPQATPESLAAQLTTTRQHATRCAVLVRAMPGADCRRVDALTQQAAQALAELETIARTHQPKRARS